jgi:hypothetical protein
MKFLNDLEGKIRFHATGVDTDLATNPSLACAFSPGLRAAHASPLKHYSAVLDILLTKQ